jgi:hypothetical protein
MTLFRTITIFLSAFSAWGIAAGQSQEGRILGTVTDQSGGLVKGARVTITNVDTGATRTLETNDPAITLHLACPRVRTSW